MLVYSNGNIVEHALSRKRALVVRQLWRAAVEILRVDYRYIHEVSVVKQTESHVGVKIYEIFAFHLDLGHTLDWTARRINRVYLWSLDVGEIERLRS